LNLDVNSFKALFSSLPFDRQVLELVDLRSKGYSFSDFFKLFEWDKIVFAKYKKFVLAEERREAEAVKERLWSELFFKGFEILNGALRASESEKSSVSFAKSMEAWERFVKICQSVGVVAKLNADVTVLQQGNISNAVLDIDGVLKRLAEDRLKEGEVERNAVSP